MRLWGVQNIVAATEGTDAVATGVIRRLGVPVQFEPELLHQLKDVQSAMWRLPATT